MLHPYMTELLAAERRRDYVRSARASGTASHLRSPRREHRRWVTVVNRFRLHVRRSAPVQLGAELGA